MTKKRKRAYVVPRRRHDYTLADSIVRVWRTQGIEVDEYNLVSDKGWFDPSPLDLLYQRRHEYEVVFVLDLGFLWDHRIHKDNYPCPVVMLAGDDPQNFEIRFPALRRLYWKIKRLVYASEKSSFTFYGNIVCAKQYDHVFTSQRFCVDWYRRRGVSASWLPYWADSELHAKAPSITPEWDVTTVMYPRLRRRAILERLAKAKDFTFRNGVGLRGGRDVALFYQKGRMVFNRSNHDEITMRIPEAAAGGRLVLSDTLPPRCGLEELYHDGEHLVLYRGTGGLFRKIRYYLRHPQEWERIAEAGRIHTLAHHTEKNRAADIDSTVSGIRTIRTPKKVGFHILSWNRPLLLRLTLESLRHALRNTVIPHEVILLDQGSDRMTRDIIDEHADFIDKPILLKENIGMSQAWQLMFRISNSDYIITLENDWWCDADDDRWLREAVRIMDDHPDIEFLKLRRIHDGQYGTGDIHTEPWTVRPFPRHIVQVGRLEGQPRWYQAPSPYGCFTFNPVIMRRSFREEIAHTYEDDPNNVTPLRSGEDRPTAYWASQRGRWSGTLIHGPFRHIGFMSALQHAVRTVPYYLRHMTRIILAGP